MNTSTPSTPEEARISEAAANWRVRHDAGLSPAEENEFMQWLEANPRHAELFFQMDASWGIAERVGELSLREIGLAHLAPTARPPWSLLPAGWGLIAAAAGIALALSLIRPEPPVVGSRMNASFSRSIESDPAALKRIDLPDGSVIRLNADSRVEVRYTTGLRAISLIRGEAHFEVAKNKVRPFIVSSSGVSVRAVGTAFDVALRAKSVEVLVTEGRVTVDTHVLPGSPSANLAPTASPSLDAGQKMVVTLESAAPPAVAPVGETEVATTLAWQEKRLKFESSPLTDILAEFNRYNARPLLIADDSQSLGSQHFAGSFRADDPETFLQLIQTRANIAIERRSDRIILHLAR